MKIALMINRENYENYSKWEDAGWELVHLGNGEPDVERVIATEADALVVDAVMKIGPDIIDKMPGLKLIHSQGVGYNAIDIEAAREAGVYVCNCAGTNARAVAEQTVLLILALIKKYKWNEGMIYAGRQMDAKMACFKDALPELGAMTVGIVGFGAIGRQLATLLKPFDCKINYYESLGDLGFEGLTFMPPEELYACCDIVTLHVPVTAETTNMINSESLKLFKRGAILINTARGELMDHKAVADALISGQLGGLGADTLYPEPFLPDNPILSDIPEELRHKVALSPHVAGITAGYFFRAYECVRNNIEAVAKGEKPKFVVNGL